MPLIKHKQHAGIGAKFKYRPRTADEVNQRKSQTGTGREGYIRHDIKLWVPKEGDNTVRILPPTWEDASSIGYEVWVHGWIGPDNSSFLCLEKMKGQTCPICEERKDVANSDDEELLNNLKPKKRVAMYIIDRAEENKGPQLWIMPWTVDRDIASVMLDSKDGVLPVDSPDEGFDLSFSKEKKKGQQFFDYVGIKFARKPSPLSDDESEAEEWLSFIQENPIPDVLVYADPDKMRSIFRASSSEEEKTSSSKTVVAGVSDDEDEEDEKPVRRQSAALKKTPPKTSASYTWEEIHAMDEDELLEVAQQHDVDMDEEFDSLEQAADHVCARLGILKRARVRLSNTSTVHTKPSRQPAVEEDEQEDEEEEEEEDQPETKSKGVDWKTRLSKYRSK